MLTALFCGGHILIEGVPGLGKTLMVKTASETLGLSFKRIQFTPDLMPSDIIGTQVLTEADGHREFQFKPGPIFAHMVLGDEINRATPKTQSAVLEAMEERQVTVFGETYLLLDPPYIVLATQNPIELEGTYPLPEAQMDRFIFKVVMGSPKPDELREILNRTTGTAQSRIQPMFEPARAPETIEDLKALVREVMVAEPVERYIIAIIGGMHSGRAWRDPGGLAVPALWSEPARRAGADPVREGQRAARRPRERELRGYRRRDHPLRCAIACCATSRLRRKTCRLSRSSSR